MHLAVIDACDYIILALSIVDAFASNLLSSIGWGVLQRSIAEGWRRKAVAYMGKQRDWHLSIIGRRWQTNRSRTMSNAIETPDVR